jgi:thiol-disulfide isomerase/thioredoxin
MVTHQLICPTCDARLKLPNPIGPGKRIRCPKCRQVFAPDGKTTVGAAPSQAVTQTVDWQQAVPDTSPTGPPPVKLSVERPRRRAQAKKKLSPLVNIGLVAVLLLIIGGAGVVIAMKLTAAATPGDAQGNAAAPVASSKSVPRVPAKQVAQTAPVLGLLVNNLAPDFDAEDVDGHRFKLSDYRGKVVFLDFWGDWCPYCRKLYPYKQDVMKKFGARPFTVVGINCEKHSDKDQARRVMQREKINWPTGWNPISEGKLVKSWNVPGFPDVTVLDHRGVIRRKGPFSDPAEWPELTTFLEQLLADCERDQAAVASGQ